MKRGYTIGALRQALRGKKIEVVVYTDRSVELIADQVLPCKVFEPVQDIPLPVDDKALYARVDAVLAACLGKENIA